MKKFILSKEFQSDFIHSLQKRNFENWYLENKEILNDLSPFLNKIEFVNKDLKTAVLCSYICNSFLEFLNSFGDHIKHVRKNFLKRALQGKEQKYVEQFEHRFHESYKNNNWRTFWSKYKYYFDCVIQTARNSNCLDVIVIGKDEKRYLNFDDAQNFWNPIGINNLENRDHFEIKSGNVVQSDSSKNRKKNKKMKKDPALEEFEKQLKEIREHSDHKELDERIASIKLEPQVPRSPSVTSTTSSNFSFRRNAMEASFQRKLNAQNEKFAEEIREMKEKRRRLNEEADEEMRRFKKESEMRIRIFLNCIHLKMRWEEQENEWNEWLKCARDPVIKVKRQLMEFDGMSRRRSYYDENEIKSEAMNLHKYIQIAYDKLVLDFGNLVILSEQYEDKLFLKVIQKSVSTMATKLCNLMDELDEFQNSKEFFSRIDQLNSSIDSFEIPTTSKVRSICKTVSTEEYQFVSPPKNPKSYCVITELNS